MNIQFVDEPDSDLVKRKSLYLDPESDLSMLLSKVQDAVEQEGFTVDRSRYKYIRGRLCKFNIELINEPDLSTLNRRATSMKKLSLNLSKLKWEFQSRSFALKIGKIQDKDLYITVAFVAEELNEPERERLKNVKDKIVKGGDSPKETTRVSFKEDEKDEEVTPLFQAPQKEPPQTNIVPKSILKNPVVQPPKSTTPTQTSTVTKANIPVKKVTPPVVMMSPSYTPPTVRPSISQPITVQQLKVQNNTQIRIPSVQPLPTRSTSMFKIRG